MKRTQFSSCDECRRSRVACDSLTRRKETGDESVSCTRCCNRHRECTFKWMQDVKTTPSTAKRKGRRRPSQTPSDLPFTRDSRSVDASAEQSSSGPSLNEGWAQEPLNIATTPAVDPMPFDYVSPVFTVASNPMSDPTADILTDVDAQWLPALYEHGFDAVFGSWMGRYGNPFVFMQDSADKYVTISDMCCQLDRWMAESSVDGQSNASGQQESERDQQIQQSLDRVIASFAVRWLPLTCQPHGGSRMKVIQTLWRRSRRDMLRVINRPSYRSIITLLLFALTSIPNGISEEEEADGISGQSCVHAALQQIQMLRARQRNLQFSGSKVSPSSMKVQAICQTPESSIGTSSFINAENTVYWTALTFDTSASLTLNCRAFLSSGLFGFEAELPWRLVRTCSKMFDEAAQHWGPSSLDMTDERANQIIGAGTSWKLLGWKLAAIFKEALRDGHHETEVRKAYTAVVDSIKEFNTIYRPHLDACEKRMQFLGQKTKLRWYSLMLHYHLSILMFVDIIEVTNRYDLLADFAVGCAEAETTVMNTIAFGLHNTYILDARPYSGSNHPTPESNGISAFSAPITVPLVSVDPYPHHVVAGIALVRKAVDRDFRVGKISKESYKSLLLTLERTLGHLPQCSKSVQAVKNLFSTKVTDESLPQHQDPYIFLQAEFGEWFTM